MTKRTPRELRVFRPAQRPPGASKARLMSPEVARELCNEEIAPEANSARLKATRPKPTKWGSARFVPLVGFVHKSKA